VRACAWKAAKAGKAAKASGVFCKTEREVRHCLHFIFQLAFCFVFVLCLPKYADKYAENLICPKKKKKIKTT